ncbi:MAG: flagellin [bacterium]
MKIRNNVASLNALRHADDNFKRIGGSIEKLSSGVAINRGADGPASLISSERLRGNIVGLQQAYENGQVSVTLLQTAEGALNEVSDILIKLKQLSVHAANEAINDEYMLEADQMEIQELIDSIDRIVLNTTFSGKQLLNGDFGVDGVTVGNDLEFVKAETHTQASPGKGYEIDITRVATRASLKGGEPLTVENYGAGLIFLVSEGGKNAKVDTSENRELRGFIEKILKDHYDSPEIIPAEKASEQIRKLVIDAIQKEMGVNNIPVEVFEAPDNTVVFRHQEFGDEASFTVTSSIPGIAGPEANEAASAGKGQDIAGTINGHMAEGNGQELTALGGTGAEGVTIRYLREIELKEVPVLDETGRQIGVEFVEESQDEIVGGPGNPIIEGYVHISQNSHNFNLGPNPQQSASISIDNLRPNKLGGGVKNKSGFRSLAEIDVRTLQGARDALTVIERAIGEISTARGRMGAFQRHTLERSLNGLKISVENNVEGESTIRDTDVAEEMSRLTSNQILFESSQAMLAQANQLPQNVLNLMGSQGS